MNVRRTIAFLAPLATVALLGTGLLFGGKDHPIGLRLGRSLVAIDDGQIFDDHGLEDGNIVASIGVPASGMPVWFGWLNITPAVSGVRIVSGELIDPSPTIQSLGFRVYRLETGTWSGACGSFPPREKRVPTHDLGSELFRGKTVSILAGFRLPPGFRGSGQISGVRLFYRDASGRFYRRDFHMTYRIDAEPKYDGKDCVH